MQLGGLVLVRALAALFRRAEGVEQTTRRQRLQLVQVRRILRATQRLRGRLGQLVDRAELVLDLATDLEEAQQLLVRSRQQASLELVLVAVLLGDRAEHAEQL